MLSNINSTLQQNDTKTGDNQNYKFQDSIMNTMNKYNTNDIALGSNYNSHVPKKSKEKCIIF
jgi:hypothetical protein